MVFVLAAFCFLVLLSNCNTQETIGSDAIITKSHFNSSHVLYLQAGPYIVLKPLWVSMQPGVRVDLYIVNYFSYQNNWSWASKRKLAEFSGTNLNRQYVFTNSSSALYALVLIGNISSEQNKGFKFQFNRSVCEVNVTTEDNPRVLYPGTGTSISSSISNTSVSCVYRISSHLGQRFTIQWIIRSTQETLRLNNSDNKNYTYYHSDRSSVSLMYQVTSSSSFINGFEILITSDERKFTLDDDGAVKVKFHKKWFYLQSGTFSLLDLHLICRTLGYGTVRSNGIRLAKSSESLVNLNFSCNTHNNYLPQCSHSIGANLHYRHYYYEPLHVLTLTCEDKMSVFLSKNRTVSTRIGNKIVEICYSGIDQYAANVLCNDLGYGVAQSYYYYLASSYNVISITNLRCAHRNTLKECDFVLSTYCSQKMQLVCSNPSNLLGIIPGYHNRGRVELAKQSVCASTATEHTANRICKDLGYLNVIKFWGTPTNRPVMGVFCNGMESSIIQCRFNYSSVCPRREALNVFCQNLALVGGNRTNEGRVEVIYNGQRGLLCDDAYDIRDGHAICRQLGYPRALSTNLSSGNSYGFGNGRFILDDLNCNGIEDDINNCNHTAWMSHNCRDNEVSGLTCLPSEDPNYCNHTGNAKIEVNATSAIYANNNRYSGIVQIRTYVSSSQWCTGVIIHEQWILTSASCFSLQTGYYRVNTNLNRNSYSISRLFIHPQYSDRQGEHNLALVKVDNLGAYNNWLCLDTSSNTSSQLTDCASVGLMANGSDVTVLMHRVNLLTDRSCQQLTRLTDTQLDSLFCSHAYTDPKTGFNGQSGGPLLCNSASGHQFVVGVTNKAIRTPNPVANEMFTNLYHYTDWIKETMARN